ncbi:MAG: nitroreductase family protein [Anaerolineae bacterium]
MDTLQAIADRRSIRRFRAEPVSRETLEEILAATVRAPSAKNQQPWRFVVLEGEAALGLAQIMKQAATVLVQDGKDIGSLAWTAAVVEQAPVTILVYDAAPPAEIPAQFHDDYRFVMLQSIGGAIQTMLLAAQALGLGSLWICDVLYCEDEINTWIGNSAGKLVAAVSLGRADEAPRARPRRPWQEVTEGKGAASKVAP